MKNIHLLPTDKPSRLYLNTQEYIFEEECSLSTDECQNKHIYITSDEEIKEGDWVVFNELEIVKCTYSKNGEFLFSEPLKSSSNHHFSYFKKIILTTDQDLIKDGVQAINDEFLEWFVNNPSCEEVEVVIEKFILQHLFKPQEYRFRYKIIIPKEEPKQECIVTKSMHSDAKMAYDSLPKKKHIVMLVGDKVKEEPEKKTVEEAAERVYTTELVMDVDISGDLQSAFINGAKWQQERMYSKEDMEESFYQGWVLSGAGVSFRDAISKFFEQFKKK